MRNAPQRGSRLERHSAKWYLFHTPTRPPPLPEKCQWWGFSSDIVQSSSVRQTLDMRVPWRDCKEEALKLNQWHFSKFLHILCAIIKGPEPPEFATRRASSPNKVWTIWGQCKGETQTVKWTQTLQITAFGRRSFFRVARLQSEVGTKDLFLVTKLLMKNAPKLFWTCLGLYFEGPKNLAKFPPNVPQDFPAKQSRNIPRQASAGAHGERFAQKPQSLVGGKQREPQNFAETRLALLFCRFGPP